MNTTHPHPLVLALLDAIRSGRIGSDASDRILSVRGVPKPQPRVKAFVRGKTGRAGVFTPGKADEWKYQIQQAFMGQGLPKLKGPLVAVVSFVLHRPKNQYRTGRFSHLLKDGAPEAPVAKPDLDNLIKAVWDSLNGIAFDDDSAIVGTIAEKRYSDHRQDECPVEHQDFTSSDRILGLRGGQGMALALLTTGEIRALLQPLVIECEKK